MPQKKRETDNNMHTQSTHSSIHFLLSHESLQALSRILQSYYTSTFSHSLFFFLLLLYSKSQSVSRLTTICSFPGLVSLLTYLEHTAIVKGIASQWLVTLIRIKKKKSHGHFFKQQQRHPLAALPFCNHYGPGRIHIYPKLKTYLLVMFPPLCKI